MNSEIGCSVCIKTRSPPASLPFKSQVSEPTTVKWFIKQTNAGTRRHLQAYFAIVLEMFREFIADWIREHLTKVGQVVFMKATVTDHTL